MTFPDPHGRRAGRPCRLSLVPCDGTRGCQASAEDERANRRSQAVSAGHGVCPSRLIIRWSEIRSLPGPQKYAAQSVTSTSMRPSISAIVNCCIFRLQTRCARSGFKRPRTPSLRSPAGDLDGFARTHLSGERSCAARRPEAYPTGSGRRPARVCQALGFEPGGTGVAEKIPSGSKRVLAARSRAAFWP